MLSASSSTLSCCCSSPQCCCCMCGCCHQDYKYHCCGDVRAVSLHLAAAVAFAPTAATLSLLLPLLGARAAAVAVATATDQPDSAVRPARAAAAAVVVRVAAAAPRSAALAGAAAAAAAAARPPAGSASRDTGADIQYNRMGGRLSNMHVHLLMSMYVKYMNTNQCIICEGIHLCKYTYSIITIERQIYVLPPQYLHT